MGDKGGDKEHYLEYIGKEYKLDRPLTPNALHTSYVIHPDGEQDRVAMEDVAGASSYGYLESARQSLPGNSLDFKTQRALANPRQLYLQGGSAFHTDVIGNEAWGYYVRTRLGLSQGQALFMAQVFSLGKDDPNDQAAIRRAYTLPRP